MELSNLINLGVLTKKKTHQWALFPCAHIRKRPNCNKRRQLFMNQEERGLTRDQPSQQPGLGLLASRTVRK